MITWTKLYASDECYGLRYDARLDEYRAVVEKDRYTNLYHFRIENRVGRGVYVSKHEGYKGDGDPRDTKRRAALELQRYSQRRLA